MNKKLIRWIPAAGLALSMTFSVNIMADDLAKPLLETVSSPEDLAKIYTFTLDGKEFSLPCSISDFQEIGWDFTYSNDMDVKIPGKTTDGAWFTNNDDSDSEIYLYFINATGDAHEMKDCRVIGIEITEGYFENVDFSTADGITIGSSREDVDTIYGVPEDADEDYYLYEFFAQYGDEGDDCFPFSDGKDTDEMEIQFEDDVVSEINMKYYKLLPEDETEVSPRQDYLDSYKAPEALSESWDDETFELDGVLYKLPVPVSILIENGWSLRDEDPLPALNYRITRMEKDDHDFAVAITNGSDYLSNLEDCYINKIYIDDGDSVPFKGPYGVTVNTTYEEICELIPELENVDFNGDTYGSYTAEDGTYYYMLDKRENADDNYCQITILSEEGVKFSASWYLKFSNFAEFELEDPNWK